MSKYNCLYSCQCGTLYMGYYMAADDVDEDVRDLVKSKIKCKTCGRFALLKDVAKYEQQGAEKMDEKLINEKIDKIHKIKVDRHNAVKELSNTRDKIQENISKTLEPYNRELRELEKDLGDVYFLYNKSNLKAELETFFYKTRRESKVFESDYTKGKYDSLVEVYKLFFTDDEIKYFIEICDKCIK